MSVRRPRRSSSKPQIIKLDPVDESPAKASGKPCIDFQPDDRWQIKEENENPPENAKQNSSNSKKKDNQVSNKKSKTSAVNGESAHHESDCENTSTNCSPLNDVKDIDTKAEDGSSKEECNNDASSPTNNLPSKRNTRVRKKRKGSFDTRANSKKSKPTAPDTNENSNDSIIHCSSGDEDNTKPAEIDDTKHTKRVTSSKQSAPVLKNETIKTDSDNEVEECSPTSGKTSKTSRNMPELLSNSELRQSDKEENSTDAKLKEPDKCDEEQKSKDTEMKVSDDGDNPEEVEDSKMDTSEDAKDLQDTENSKLEKPENSDVSKDDPSITEIIDDDDKKSGENSGDSDNEIQIIEGESSKAKKAKLNEKFLPPIGDGKSSSEEILLSAGYPYYNSLAEKIKDFKAGVYNPVKFPHMGTLYLSDSEVIIESPSLLVPLLIKESDEFPKAEGDSAATDSKPAPVYRKNFFQSSVGQFLINLGASRVLEWYHRDMKRIAHKHARKGGHSKQLEETIKQHDKKCIEAKEANLAFNFRLRRCQFCEFKTESLIVMESHYLIPHMSLRREFKCNFCSFLTRDPKEITFHFEAIHGKKAVLENQMLLHECLFCTFQSHLKSKVNIHMNRCRKNFIQSQNQSPPYDFEFPGVTTKPVSLADISGHRRMLLGSVKAQPGTFESFVQSAFAKKKLSSVLNFSGMDTFPDSPTLVKHLMGPQSKPTTSGYQLPPGIVLTRPRVRAQQVRQVSQHLQPRGLANLRPTGSSLGYPNNIPSGISITPVGKVDPKALGVKNLTLTPISSAGSQVVAKGGPPQPVALFTNVAGSDASRGRIAGIAPGSKLPVTMSGRGTRMVPPYQRLNTPPSQVVKNSSGSTFVVCEICDSYIKDLEELRSHMNWVHKVKIHPKMLVSRPPLNCQKCQWRFFTDQGLERHLLGAHGLVTTNMQEMANNNQDGGRCIICGAVFTYKLVSHMTQVHKVTLKPAHLSYKCTVCTATFTLYRLFESHVYNVHSGAAKRNAEDPAPSEPPAKKAATVVTAAAAAAPPPPTTTTTAVTVEPKETIKESVSRKCKDCGFITEFLEKHIITKHMKQCSIKICRIDKCEKCLYSSDEMLVIPMSDMESDEEDSSDSGDSDGSDASSEDDKDDESSVKEVTPDSIKTQKKIEKSDDATTVTIEEAN